jgi:hypothetical protein
LRGADGNGKEKGASTKISVLNVASWLFLRLDNVVSLFCHVLNEHFLNQHKQLLVELEEVKGSYGCDCDGERGVVRAHVDIRVLTNDLLYS